MAPLAQTIQGRLMLSDEHAVLVLNSTDENVLLRFAFIQFGDEAELLPESLLDDWGHERKSLELYQWIHENGLHFPRAELFGYDSEGRKKQCFLRELDLQSRYPCYGYSSAGMRIANGTKISSFLIVNEETEKALQTDDIGVFPLPMRNAEVDWWLVNAANASELAKSLLLYPGSHHP